MVLTWNLNPSNGTRTSAKVQYDFRLDEQDWEKVCWGRVSKAAARSTAHQLSRRAKWAAVLRRAASPEGGGWKADFKPEDMTPQRLQALARLIDLEFFQGTFHREVKRQLGRQVSYRSGDIKELYEDAVPRGDAVMAAAAAAGLSRTPQLSPSSRGFKIAKSFKARWPTAANASGGSLFATAAEATAMLSKPEAVAAAGEYPRPWGLRMSGPAFRVLIPPRRCCSDCSQGHMGSNPIASSHGSGQTSLWAASTPAACTSAAGAIAGTRERCTGSSIDLGTSSSSRNGHGSFSGLGSGGGGGGGGEPGEPCGVRGPLRWLRRWWRHQRHGRGGDVDGGGGGGAGVDGGTRGADKAVGVATAADAVAPSATYQHSLGRITFWRQVWASYSPSMGNPMRLDGVVCASRLCWLAHTMGHEMLHAMLFSMCGQYARYAPQNMSMEGHGYNFLVLNWYVLGHRGYTYNPRGWRPPPALPCRL